MRPGTRRGRENRRLEPGGPTFPAPAVPCSRTRCGSGIATRSCSLTSRSGDRSSSPWRSITDGPRGLKSRSRKRGVQNRSVIIETALSAVSYPVRKWWNWQTHHLEGVAPKGVGVQIPPSAPATPHYETPYLSRVASAVCILASPDRRIAFKIGATARSTVLVSRRQSRNSPSFRQGQAILVNEKGRKETSARTLVDPDFALPAGDS